MFSVVYVPRVFLSFRGFGLFPLRGLTSLDVEFSVSMVRPVFPSLSLGRSNVGVLFSQRELSNVASSLQPPPHTHTPLGFTEGQV